MKANCERCKTREHRHHVFIGDYRVAVCTFCHSILDESTVARVRLKRKIKKERDDESD